MQALMYVLILAGCLAAAAWQSPAFLRDIAARLWARAHALEIYQQERKRMYEETLRLHPERLESEAGR